MKYHSVIIPLFFHYLPFYSIAETKGAAVKIKDSNNKRIICYYAFWSSLREKFQFTIEYIEPELCTHMIYAFAIMDDIKGIQPYDEEQDIKEGGYTKFTGLKKSDHNLKIILSVVSYEDAQVRYAKVGASQDLRSSFAKNCKDFLMNNGFDGMELVWKYPFFVNSSLEHKQNYIELVKSIREEFSDKLILSLAVPSIPMIMDSDFHFPEFTKYIDFLNIITYNYHMTSELVVNHGAPLYSYKQDPFKELNVNSTITTYLNLGIDPEKLNLGISLNGLSFTLNGSLETNIGSETNVLVNNVTERDEIGYYQLCRMLKREPWIVVHVNETAVGPYAYKGKQWIAYDDEAMVRTKALYAVEKKLGGLMFWSVDSDDYGAACHSMSFPLIRAGREALLKPEKNNIDIN